jgi:DoxX-like protein
MTTMTHARTIGSAPSLRADAAPGATSPRRLLVAGRILSGIPVLFLLLDAGMKVLQLPAAVEGTKQVGYRPEVVLPLGIVQLACLVLYLVPRTAVLGAILWTGYLGGAVATHVRIGDPLLTHVLAPVYVASFLWLGLWLRDARLRALVPLRTAAGARARR